MAGFNLGDIFVTFKANTESLDNGVKSLRRMTDEAEKSSSRLGAFTTKLGAMAKTTAKVITEVATVAGAAASVATGFAVKSAAEFEQTRIGLENMLGSADNARKVLAEVSDFAAKTPFEFPELAQAVRQLVAFGFGGDEAISTMKELGDVSAAVGAPINDLAYLMGTLRTQGRAFTIDIRQFAMRGIPIYEYLAKVLGKTEAQITDMIEAGKIGFPEVQKAFTAMTSEGGKFHGTMEKQSRSLAGLWSTFKDNIGLAAREIVGINQQGDIRKGSIFDWLRIGLEKFNEYLGKINWTYVVQQVNTFVGTWATRIYEVAKAVSDYLGPKLKTLFDNINIYVIPVMKRLWEEIIAPLIPVIGDLLVGAFGAVIDILNILIPIFSGFVDWCIQNKDWLIPIIGSLAALKGAFMIWDAIDKVRVAMVVLQTTTIPELITSFGLLSATVSAPMAIVISTAAALAAIWAVWNEYNKMQEAIKGTEEAWKNATRLRAQAILDLKKVAEMNHAPYDQATIDRANNARKTLRSWGVAGYALGTPFFGGGMALVGENGPETVILPRGSQIKSNQDTKDMLRGGNNYSLNFSGVFARSDTELADIIYRGISELDRRLGAAGKPQIMGGNA